jgi:hypothetical protein
LKQIPAELDQLMWLVAESGDPAGIEEFGEKYPGHRIELLARIDMIRKLRGARSSPSGGIPPFRRPAPSRIGARRAWTFALAGACLAALAVGSFYGTLAWQRRGEAALRNVNPPAAEARSEPARGSAESSGGSIPPTPNPSTEEFSEPDGVELRRVTIESERIKLSSLLDRIGRECGLTLEVAPGLEDPEIRVSYQNMTGPEMLLELGPRFGFTAFDQGDGKVLVIPAIDQAAKAGQSRVQPGNVGTARPREGHDEVGSGVEERSSGG